MTGAFDPLADRAAEAAPSIASGGYDPLAMVAAGKSLPAANEPSASPPSSSAPAWEQDWLKHGDPVDQFVQGAFDQAITSTVGAIAGGLKGLWDIAAGRKEGAPGDVEQIEQSNAFKPETTAQRWGATAAASNWNPLNWPGVVVGKAGELLGAGAEKLGAPPIVSTLAQVAPAAVVSVAGLRSAGIKPGEGYVPEIERVTPEGTASQAAPSSGGAAPRAPAPDGPPIEGGLPKEAQAERDAILKRVGITQARNSATEGDAKAAATDYQISKTDEPAGQEVSAQF